MLILLTCIRLERLYKLCCVLRLYGRYEQLLCSVITEQILSLLCNSRATPALLAQASGGAAHYMLSLPRDDFKPNLTVLC